MNKYLILGGFMSNKGLSLRKRPERFNPWSVFQDEMKDFMSRFNEDWPEMAPLEMTTPSHFVPRIDLKDNGDSYLVTAEIPGMKEKDISVSLDQNVLTLEGEKKAESEEKGKGYFRSEISYGTFFRTIPLHEEIDEGKVEANYKDGVLKVTLAKKEGAGRKKKKIEIKSHTHMQ
jgi:HSP20 family protein